MKRKAKLITKREMALIRMAWMLGFMDGRAEGCTATLVRRKKLMDEAVKLVVNYVKESRKKSR